MADERIYVRRGDGMEEGEGFEPPIPFRTVVFKTACFNRSHIPPHEQYQQFSSTKHRRPRHCGDPVMFKSREQLRKVEVFQLLDGSALVLRCKVRSIVMLGTPHEFLQHGHQLRPLPSANRKCGGNLEPEFRLHRASRTVL